MKSNWRNVLKLQQFNLSKDDIYIIWIIRIVFDLSNMWRRFTKDPSYYMWIITAFNNIQLFLAPFCGETSKKEREYYVGLWTFVWRKNISTFEFPSVNDTIDTGKCTFFNKSFPSQSKGKLFFYGSKIWRR